MTNLTELLADCDGYGIRLFPSGKDELTIDAPRGVLTPDLIERLKVHKAGLMKLLRPTPGIVSTPTATTNDSSVSSTERSLIASSPSQFRRLVGNGFSPIRSPPPPDDILADPVITCRECKKTRVLSGIPGSKHGVCFYCYV